LSGAPNAVAKTPSAADRLAITISTAGGIGLAPVSPGTFGSIPGLALGLLLHTLAVRWWPDALVSQRQATIVALVIFTALAMWAVARTERFWNTHDDQRIVADEVLGMAIGVAFITPTLLHYAVAFGLFRLLDIWKPGPIGWLDEKAPGAWGTMSDDLLAGILTALVMVFVF
jgi:phosphatidylglycerophosphatase A